MEAHNPFVLHLQICYWRQSDEKSQTATKEQYMKLSILPYYVNHVFNGIQVWTSWWNTEDFTVNNIIFQLSLSRLLYRVRVLKDKFVFRLGTPFKSNRKSFFYKLFVMDAKEWCVRIALLTHGDSFLIGYGNKQFYRATIVSLFFPFSCGFKSLSMHSPYFWVRCNSFTVRVSFVVEFSSIIVKTISFLPTSF